MAGKSYQNLPLADRFAVKVDRRGPDECWPWTGKVGGHGYGVIHENRRALLAHRVALVLDGRPPGSLFALHHCDNRPCVNPAHLYVGTMQDNMRDMADRGRQWRQRQDGRCHNGHVMDEANTYRFVGPNGRQYRHCRACNRAAKARQLAKRKAANA